MGECIDRTILLGARIDDAGAGVCEPGELDAVLFTEQAFIMTALFDVIYLDGLVAG